MNREIRCLEKNKTYEIVEKPENEKIIDVGYIRIKIKIFIKPD